MDNDKPAARRRWSVEDFVSLGVLLLLGVFVGYCAYNLTAGLSYLIRLAIAQRALLRDVLLELRHAGDVAAAAFDDAMAAAFPAEESAE